MLIFNQRHALMPQSTTAADETAQAQHKEAQRQALLVQAQQRGGYSQQPDEQRQTST